MRECRPAGGPPLPSAGPCRPGRRPRVEERRARSRLRPDATEELTALLRERILVIDGAMGTMIQRHRPGRGGLPRRALRGLAATTSGQHRPAHAHPARTSSAQIHREYLDAGADIVETNTFNARRAISQADYGMEDLAYEINLAAARLAREAADAVTELTPDRPRYVAGALGPTNRTASISPDVNDPGARNVTYDELVEAYLEQARGLVDGGADLLHGRDDLRHAQRQGRDLRARDALRGARPPLAGRSSPAPSPTPPAAPCRARSTEAFWNSVRHARPLAVGLNCALGATEMRPYVAELSPARRLLRLRYPNAGLPNAFGEYDEAPDQTRRGARGVRRAAAWSTWSAAAAAPPRPTSRRSPRAVDGRGTPRAAPTPSPALRLSGLEPLNDHRGRACSSTSASAPTSPGRRASAT